MLCPALEKLPLGSESCEGRIGRRLFRKRLQALRDTGRTDPKGFLNAEFQIPVWRLRPCDGKPTFDFSQGFVRFTARAEGESALIDRFGAGLRWVTTREAKEDNGE